MSHVDEVFEAAALLSPDDRVLLIARLWKSLPQECWPRPTSDELIEVDRLLAKENIDRNGPIPWPLVERIFADSVRSSRPKVYSAPRRFDLSTVMVITAGYALLFGGLNMILRESESPAGVALVVGVFITLIGVGQAFMFGGRKPRTASITVGAILTSLITFGTIWMFNRRGIPGRFVPSMLIYGVVSGAIYGYLAGVLVGGVFLVADVIRKLLRRDPSIADPEAHSAASPFDAS